MIKLVCSDRDAAIRLDFAKNFIDRDAVRDVLHRLHAQEPPRQLKPPPPANVAPLSKEDIRRRAKLLEHAEVRRLHNHLVNRNHALSDEKFWAGIKYKYKPNGERRGAARDDDDDDYGATLPRGIPTNAFEPPGEDISGLEPPNWTKGVPSPAQRHRIFLVLPVAARAYKGLVPGKMEEKSFWATLAKSSMARKISKDIRLKRSAATATQADAVFAEFHAGEQAAVAREAAARANALHAQLDLARFDDHRSAHVLEGHGATGDAPRYATRASRNQPMSTNLRIMREVNRHGQLIVDSTCETPKSIVNAAPSWRPDDDARGTPLEDLMEIEQPRFAALSADAVQKATPVFNADEAGGRGVASSDVQMFVDYLEGWQADMSALKHPIASSGSTLVSLLTQMRP